MAMGSIVIHQRRRSWWRRRRVRGWSKANVWRLRLLFGLSLSTEPVLMALEPRATGERVGLMRIRIPHTGIEILMCDRMAWWRQTSKAPRTPAGLRESAAGWQSAQREAGFRTWLSEAEARLSKDPQKLEAVLCRALVMEVLGRRGRRRSR